MKHSPTHQFGLFSFIFILSAGFIVIGLNYWADRQKQITRATNGKCIIWGKPAKVIRYIQVFKYSNSNVLFRNLTIYLIFSASYIDDYGKSKKSILLASGFWGITRHMNYTFELMTAFVWSLPALLASPIPYFYFIFLLILLTHRTVRDDNKCSKKYGIYWSEYCKIVKYQMIPGIY